ncbi:ABC transporter substrate-binding protein [Butyrivibrio sp.]|jgi:multiple sugar transport system substrate-binding protein|uniref:ABC transporter substrate-binding protein n=1 Tax=Butyrivibrio sp. TaxID=28121 RepID=UPI0025C1A3A8|nr:ABC transporter substrate-binding protein [Butyrivibrio sp.]MBE5839669.1 carbohydrate ABC transporter substrate-binding protein [Butyrivibrio sp.]MBQ6415495.1 carbohydrate ABC transporter substrate-binding protein [Butyrivibrio sp.]
MKIKTVRMAKRMLGLTSALAMVFCFTACGQKAEESTEFKPALSSEISCQIKVAGDYSNFESLESEFERFYEYYPNVSLNYVNLDDYRNTITSALMSDEAPDIYVTASWMLEDDKMAPVFENAEVLSDPALDINLECIRKGARWTLENGDVVMLPIFTRSYGMLVNMDLFEKNGLEVPENYSDLVDACDKFKAAGYETPVMGANGLTVAGMYYPFAFPLFCDEVLKKPESVEPLNSMEKSAGEMMRPALEKIKTFVDKGYMDPERCSNEIEDDYNAVIMRFFEGDVPMMLGSGDMVSGTQKRESKSEAFVANPFKYKFYVVPIGDEGGYFLDSVNLFFSVNKNSPNLDMTNEFIRFIMREKELGNMAAIKRLITPTNDFSLDEVYSSLEGFPEDRYFSYQETGLNDAVNKEFRAAAYNVANGIMTVDEAISGYGSLWE